MRYNTNTTTTTIGTANPIRTLIIQQFAINAEQTALVVVSSLGVSRSSCC